MLFSAKTEYACLALLELAARSGDARPARLADLAERYDIPQRFLVQILLQLKGAKLVDSVRGAAGGYALARPPQAITLAEVVAAIDPHAGPARPARSGPHARFAHTANAAGVVALREVWKEVETAQRRVLEGITLADLAARAERQGGLLYEI